ncbi:beta family protein [Thalassolituus alkanivorans]|uniref:beta family protein n=1 Tax=Thalassolituus alkanivorans TaxID=2881055 RepID=UPI001E522D9F|nr:beta family protein [Thalassolituus alkanivorans]MCB2386352.1 beta family protein [Thalassolituus alkanivorans]MCB2422099.1 beta family protein [Thalassolituus alkanivorans]|tara:strand:- start:2932 stop:3990 length:1059 start_codon:yes stop_codon:yes gene_type:complete
MSTKYYPFLKLKQNEVAALGSISSNILSDLTPLFDIPKTEKESPTTAQTSVEKGIKFLNKSWDKSKNLLIDCKDIITLSVNNQHIYDYTISRFKEEGFNFTPVLALNRDKGHNECVQKHHTQAPFSKIAIRLERYEIDDFYTCEAELSALLAHFQGCNITIIIDIAVIHGEKDAQRLITPLTDFIQDISTSNTINYSTIVFTSSVISANFNEHTPAKKSSKLPRFEYFLYEQLRRLESNLIYGDYGIVSPEYSDSGLPIEFIYQMSTPKLIYTGRNEYYIFRGGSLKTNGNKQYFKLAKEIVSLEEFRGAHYSSGEKFIDQKSKEIGSPSSQGNWYKFLNVSHITYIVKDFL